MKWHDLVAALRAARKWRRRLVVRRVEMDDHGCCSLSDSGKTITVAIRKKDSLATQTDTLVHEMAHAAIWDDWEEHGAEWGKWQAAFYRATIGEK